MNGFHYWRTRGTFLGMALLVFFAPFLAGSTPSEPIIQHLIITGPPVDRLEGVVKDSTGHPMPGVKIELYDHPEVWFDKKFKTSQDKRKKQKKLGETVTDIHGRFALKRNRKGEYELYCTVSGFNPLSFIVRLVPRKPEAEELEITMHIAG